MYTDKILKYQPASAEKLIGTQNLYFHGPTNLYIAPADTTQTLVRAGGVLVVQGSRWMIKVGSDLAACFNADGTLNEQELRTFRFNQPGPGVIVGHDVKSSSYYPGWYVSGKIACSHSISLREHFTADEPIHICAVLSRADRGVLLSHQLTPGPRSFTWSNQASLANHWSPYVRALTSAGYDSPSSIVSASDATELQPSSTNQAQFVFPFTHGLGELISYIRVPLRASLDAAFEHWIANDGDFKAEDEFRQAWAETRGSCFEKYSIPFGLEYCGNNAYAQRRWKDTATCAGYVKAGPHAAAPSSAETYDVPSGESFMVKLGPKLRAGLSALAGGAPYFESSGLTVFNMCAAPEGAAELDKVVLQVPFSEHVEKHASALVNLLTGRAIRYEDAESISVQQAIVRHAIWPEGEGFPMLADAPANMNQQQANAWANEQIVQTDSNNDRLNRLSGRASALDLHVTAVVKKTTDRWKQLV